MWIIIYTAEDSGMGGKAFREYTLQDSEQPIYFDTWTNAARFLASEGAHDVRTRADIVKMEIVRVDIR